MGKVTRNSGMNDFAPVPEGTYQGVIVDAVDLGFLEKTFQGQSQGLKPHIQLVYQVGGVAEDENGDEYEPMRDDGKPWLVFGRRHVLSMNERAGFYKEVCGILGKKGLEATLEEETFDTEMLVGRNVRFTVVHNEGGNGQTYANIENMVPWLKRDGASIEARDYVRRHEREGYEEPEFSSFGDGPKAVVQRAAPVTPRQDDPRSVNQTAKGHSQQYAKDVAAGREPKGMKVPAKQPVLPDGAEDFDEADPFEDA